MIREVQHKVLENINRVLHLRESSILIGDDLRIIGLDSIKTVVLIVELEESFDITFDDDELLFENFNVPDKIINLIIKKVGAK
ncbi:acyl carrier protein [Paenibacillus allorhizosphaerae]|uniref:Carrier domain-containing protein n=1 Tax=Paenibacillus allorhizosphaerae TaxID=2849866 RepID=A0ABN7TWV2_9BACL|nr:acyl carrier protein [Paenibacillus allorhizosphaerae]CAG7658914.1 hypothetical protein PAECIP111802_07212 [Paenibacillus allorhizosphaerae]